MLEPMLDKALTRTGLDKDWSTESLLQLCQSGEMQCWVAHENDEILVVALTEIVEYPLRKVLGIPFVGAKRGSIRRWLGHLEMLKDYARENDCEAIRGGGRFGWKRAIKPDVARFEFDIEVER